jgi:hypothetical protein
MILLFGSGISKKAGLPMVSDITNRILSGREIARHSDSNYYLMKPFYGQDVDEYVEAITEFIGIIDKIIKDQFKEEDTSIDYEKLYEYLDQIVTHESYPIKTPLITPFALDLKEKSRKIIFELEKKSGIPIDYFGFLFECLNFISDVTWHLLNGKTESLEYLKWLANIIEVKRGNEPVEIFTLNHDVIIERFFDESRINYVDGFDRSKNGIRRWNPIDFNNHDVNVKLYKVHGSISWFHYENEKTMEADYFAIDPKTNPYDKKDEQGNLLWPIDGRPRIILGAALKFRAYTWPIFSEMYHRLWVGLQCNKHLIVCGYGFGDWGINNAIFNWFVSNGEKQISIIEPDPKGLRERLSPSILGLWNDAIEKGKIVIIPKRAEEISSQDIEDSRKN